MASIHKRYRNDGTPRYVVAFLDPYGKRTERVAGSTKKSAEALKVKIERELAAGTYGQARAKDPAFQEFCDDFLAARKTEVKPSTHTDYTEVIKNHILPFFKGYRLTEITSALVQEFLGHLETKGISAATRGKIFRYLKAMLRHGLALELISRDPCVAIRAPRVPRKEMDFLNPEEIKRLLAACDDNLRPMIAVACYAGLRQGELLGLQWSDVDFKTGIIKVLRTYSTRHGFREPKSESSRRGVPISPALAVILKEYYVARQSPGPDELVFPNREGRPRDRANLVERDFNGTLARAGIRKISFHTLRSVSTILRHLPSKFTVAPPHFPPLVPAC